MVRIRRIGGTIASSHEGFIMPSMYQHNNSNWTYLNRVEFTTSGSWTVPAGVTRCKALMVGGGGFSGHANGGQAGMVKEIEITVTPAASMPYVIGAAGTFSSDGGNTTFGGAIAWGGKSTNSSLDVQETVFTKNGIGFGSYGRGNSAAFAAQPGYLEILY